MHPGWTFFYWQNMQSPYFFIGNTTSQNCRSRCSCLMLKNILVKFLGFSVAKAVRSTVFLLVGNHSVYNFEFIGLFFRYYSSEVQEFNELLYLFCGQLVGVLFCIRCLISLALLACEIRLFAFFKDFRYGSKDVWHVDVMLAHHWLARIKHRYVWIIWMYACELALLKFLLCKEKKLGVVIALKKLCIVHYIVIFANALPFGHSEFLSVSNIFTACKCCFSSCNSVIINIRLFATFHYRVNTSTIEAKFVCVKIGFEPGCVIFELRLINVCVLMLFSTLCNRDLVCWKFNVWSAYNLAFYTDLWNVVL